MIGKWRLKAAEAELTKAFFSLNQRMQRSGSDRSWPPKFILCWESSGRIQTREDVNVA